AGGSGLSAVEHALFFREVGRQCGPVDVLAQSLAANAIADDALRAEVIAGSRGVALIVADGAATRRLGSAEAEFALPVPPDGAELIPLAGAETLPRPALDPANSMGLVTTLARPIERSEGDRVWQLGQLGTAAMLVGIAEAALDLITKYAKVRET